MSGVKLWERLAFLLHSCYTQPRCKALKNKVVMGLAADSRRRVGNKVPDSRDIRQMDTQVCPPDSLFAENAPSVRDLPLVKQN